MFTHVDWSSQKMFASCMLPYEKEGTFYEGQCINIFNIERFLGIDSMELLKLNGSKELVPENHLAETFICLTMR